MSERDLRTNQTSDCLADQAGSTSISLVDEKTRQVALVMP